MLADRDADAVSLLLEFGKRNTDDSAGNVALYLVSVDIEIASGDVAHPSAVHDFIVNTKVIGPFVCQESILQIRSSNGKDNSLCPAAEIHDIADIGIGQ